MTRLINKCELLSQFVLHSYFIVIEILAVGSYKVYNNLLQTLFDCTAYVPMRMGTKITCTKVWNVKICVHLF